jgi:predicted TIM-barrel fold metal-dependent hydrolase
MANRQGRIYYDFSRLGILNSGPGSFIDKVGADNVVFGSVMPMQYIETQFVKLRFSNLEANVIEKILYKNIKELFEI